MIYLIPVYIFCLSNEVGVMSWNYFGFILITVLDIIRLVQFPIFSFFVGLTVSVKGQIRSEQRFIRK